MVDIHSHIIPCVDDGAKNADESLKLLEMLKEQGVTDVFATSHFYPFEEDIKKFKKIKNEFEKLKDAINDKDLPKIHFGCEFLYFDNMGESDSIAQFCFEGSDFLLLELTDESINKRLFNDLLLLRDNLGITPVIAHVERYFKAKKYKEFIKFIKSENILTQIDADSLLTPFYYRATKKLIKSGVATFIASDAHSSEDRPPRIKEALEKIEKIFGEECKELFINNSKTFLQDVLENSQTQTVI